MARQIEVNLVSDAKDFERSMKAAGGAAEKFEADLKSADAAASRFDGALDKTTDKLGSATNGFRSTADLAGGLGDVLGISAIGPIAGYATGMADIADGMGGLLQPALAKSKAAFAAMNATMLANPIFLVIAAIAALGIAFVIAYKKSETFRKIVHKVFDTVKSGAIAFKDAVVDAVTGAAKKIGKIADIITTPYQLAFRAIASLWNNTVGKMSFSIPGWVPGIGGMGFDVPDIPMLAKGGTAHGGRPHIVGERGPELFVPNMTGTVIPNGGFGGGTVVVTAQDEAGAALLKVLRFELRRTGGSI
jgi:phage-related protein